MTKENKFKSDLIKTLKRMFHGCIILNNDPIGVQGIPDILILHRDRWAMLECKRTSQASVRPNQGYFINKANEMSFGAFIYPENKDDVLSQLERWLL